MCPRGVESRGNENDKEWRLEKEKEKEKGEEEGKSTLGTQSKDSNAEMDTCTIWYSI